ncbi:2-hydroxychromene-2-carboxylate isomerase [Hydrogenophaga sp.]|uniref:2-hydroxychromene-2-carboxylate isomerase n=1 Tax=Hydrogenophaga sp. TaxID=1904254 RepID=UPI003F6ED3F2
MKHAEPIDFYFDFLSMYGYFASLRIEAIAARHGREVRWHSMLLGVSVMKTMGLKPLLETPLKGDYVIRDSLRYMRRHGLQLQRQPADPMMDPRPAARAFYWLRHEHPGTEVAFAREVLDRYWRQGMDLGDPDAVAHIAPLLGLRTDAVREGMESELARDELRAAVAASLERGVFGSPFFFIDGEPFWGSDRLEQVDDWLATGGW